MSRKWIIAVAAALGLGIVGCKGNPVRSKVESSVAANLPDIIGPADSYSVRAYGPTLRLLRGKLDGLDITGTNVKLPNGMNVARLFVKIRDLTVDTDTHKIKQVGTTEFSATLSEAELSRYLASRYPAVPGLGVALTRGVIGLSAKPGVSIIRLSVNADAELEVREERILALKLKKMNVAGIGVPNFARDFIESKVGTIFDANDLGFDAKISSAEVAPGSLTLKGTLDLLKLQDKRG